MLISYDSSVSFFMNLSNFTKRSCNVSINVLEIKNQKKSLAQFLSLKGWNIQSINTAKENKKNVALNSTAEIALNNL